VASPSREDASRWASRALPVSRRAGGDASRGGGRRRDRGASREAFAAYGRRGVGASGRRGRAPAPRMIVNPKKTRRLGREQELQPRRGRRWAATTRSDHARPIVPNVAHGFRGARARPALARRHHLQRLGHRLRPPCGHHGRPVAPRRRPRARARDRRPPRHRPPKAAVEHRRPVPGCVLHEPTGAGSTPPGRIGRF
jgi:hypothetical protein